MRLRHIEVFHAVYSAGSVTAAAKILNVSQPSVSKVLAHAEQQLGYSLFDRTRGKLVPTPEADRLFVHVTAVNNSVERLRQVAGNLRLAEEGRIRVAATPAFGMDVLPAAIASFRKQRSDVRFTVETQHYDAICTALQESKIDVGLVFDPDTVPGITRERLAAGSFFVLTPPGLEFGSGQSLTVKDLEAYPFISLDRRGPLGQLLSHHVKSSGVTLRPIIHAETYQVARSLVAHGAGVTITDELTARTSFRDGVSVWPLAPKLEFEMAALHLDSTPMSLVCRDFVEHVRQHIRAVLGSAIKPSV